MATSKKKQKIYWEVTETGMAPFSQRYRVFAEDEDEVEKIMTTNKGMAMKDGQVFVQFQRALKSPRELVIKNTMNGQTTKKKY